MYDEKVKKVSLDRVTFDLKVTRTATRTYIEVFAKEYENDDTLHIGGSIKLAHKDS